MRVKNSPLVLVVSLCAVAALLWTGCNQSASTSTSDDLDSLASTAATSVAAVEEALEIVAAFFRAH